MPVSFSLSVRRRCCSQVGQDVLRQDAAVRRYAPRGIRIMRAQQSPPFPGTAFDVLAPQQLRTRVTLGFSPGLISVMGVPPSCDLQP